MSQVPKPNPIAVQHQVVQNSTEYSSYIKGLDNWLVDVKAGELAQEMIAKDVPPLANAKTKEKLKPSLPNGNLKDLKDKDETAEEKRRISSYDYAAWDKFDVDKALEDDDESSPLGREEMIQKKAEEITRKTRGEEFKENGNKLIGEKKYTQAIESYSQGIEFDSDSAVLFANRAQAYMSISEYKKAIHDCDNAISLDCTYVKAYFRRAKCHICLQNNAKAISDLKRVLTLEPHNKEASRLLMEQEKFTQMPKSLSTGSFPKYQSSSMKTSSSTNLGGSKSGNRISYELNPSGKTTTKLIFPRIIEPIEKPLKLRSKRPLLPVPIKLEEGSGDNTPIKVKEEVKEVPSSPVVPVAPKRKPTTSLQFFLDWRQIKDSSELAANYLRAFESKDFEMMADSMEYSLLSDIIDCLVWEFIPRGWSVDPQLEGFLKVKRLGTLLLFLTEKDRANLRKLLDYSANSNIAAAYKTHGF